MNWNLWRRRAAPALSREPEPEPASLSAEEYRASLLSQILARDARLPETLRLINAAITEVPDPEERKHLYTHVPRWLLTVAMLPDGPGDLIDIAAVPYYAEALYRKQWRLHNIAALEIDFETDRLPFGDSSADAVLLCEVIEHFVLDPMFCLIEINRILKDGGAFIVTTPNAASWFAIYEALHHRHPSRWPVYSGDPKKTRNHIHAREYTCTDLRILLNAAGFGNCEMTTLDYGIAPPHAALPGFDSANRGETIFATCRKVGLPKYRYVKPVYLESEQFSSGTPCETARP